MEKKSNSKPMKEILDKIACEEIEIVIFPEETILFKDV
jgi:hypothetical protein